MRRERRAQEDPIRKEQKEKPIKEELEEMKKDSRANRQTGTADDGQRQRVYYYMADHVLLCPLLSLFL